MRRATLRLRVASCRRIVACTRKPLGWRLVEGVKYLDYRSNQGVFEFQRLKLASSDACLRARAPRRRLRRPPDRPAGGGQQRHGHATGPPGWHARQSHPRRVGGLFPPRPARSDSMRSGPSWPRSRRTATPPTPTMITAATTGITWPSIPSTNSSWRWSPGRGRGERPRDRLGG